MVESPDQKARQKPAVHWLAYLAPALRIRNFRLFWVGLMVSTMGTYLQQLAEGWLIYDMTGSSFLLGVLGFIGLLPVVPIAFLGGVIIDRVPRRKLIMITQTGLLLQAALFGVLVLSGHIRVWQIIVLDFFLGALYSIDLPARQAFLVELVGSDDLPNAIALNATTINLSRVVGYVLAGVLIAAAGVGGAMLINAATYLAPLTALLLIRVIDAPQDTQRRKLGAAMSEGVLTVLRKPSLIGVIGLMALVGGFGSAIYILMPAFADDVLHTDSVGLGLLLGAAGLGAVISSLLVSRFRRGTRGLMLSLFSLLLPISLVFFASSRSLALACVLLVAHGIVLLALHALANTLVQVNVPDRVRGRVMSLYSLLNAGGPKIGSIMIGGLADRFGLPLMISAAGAVSVLFAFFVGLVMPAVRRME